MSGTTRRSKPLRRLRDSHVQASYGLPDCNWIPELWWFVRRTDRVVGNRAVVARRVGRGWRLIKDNGMKKAAPQTEGQLLAGLFKTLDDHFKDYLALRLTGFADQLRTDLDDGQDLHDLESDAALFLSNLCEYLDLSTEHRAQVLGPQAVAYIDVLEGNDATIEVGFEAVVAIEQSSAA